MPFFARCFPPGASFLLLLSGLSFSRLLPSCHPGTLSFSPTQKLPLLRFHVFRIPTYSPHFVKVNPQVMTKKHYLGSNALRFYKCLYSLLIQVEFDLVFWKYLWKWFSQNVESTSPLPCNTQYCRCEVHILLYVIWFFLSGSFWNLSFTLTF